MPIRVLRVLLGFRGHLLIVGGYGIELSGGAEGTGRAMTPIGFDVGGDLLDAKSRIDLPVAGPHLCQAWPGSVFDPPESWTSNIGTPVACSQPCRTP